ncbi:MAG: DsrE/DsrF/DrsH-like family protein [Vicinamibacterales bacterium]
MATSAIPQFHAGAQPVPAAADRLTIVVFSGELDRLMAAFTMASGAAACGVDVTMFFTFWGAAFLKSKPTGVGKTIIERCFGWMLPGGAGAARLSRMNLGGVGRYLMLREMKRKGLPSLDELMQLAQESGVRFAVCESSMSMIGVRREELTDSVTFEMCGVAHLWDRAAGGQIFFV